jgi:8-oxo-dGTP diphosphatase
MIKYTVVVLMLAVFSCRATQPEMYERNKKPKGSMSYAILLLINEKSEVLLLRRKGASFGDGLYSLPGGKIESGETALEAAQREAREEIGLTVDQLKLVHVVDRQGTETEFYVFVFKPQLWQGVPFNSEPDKHDDMRWFPLDKLPEKLIPAHRQAIELSQDGIAYSQHGWDAVVLK